MSFSGDNGPSGATATAGGPSRRAGITLLAATVTIAGCGARPSPTTESPLVVSAAVSLREPLGEALSGFGGARPGAAPMLNAGASGLLLQQLLRGAPADLYISASTREIDRLEEAGRLLPESRITLAANRMALVVPRGRPRPDSVTRLGDPAYRRVAIGNPGTVPAGRYARQVLERAGVWDTLRTRLVTAESARQTLEYVARGEVDAGLVYRTDVAVGGERVELAAEIPADLHDPILYEGAVLADSARPRAALELLRYLAAGEGRRELVRHGFLPPPGR